MGNACSGSSSHPHPSQSPAKARSRFRSVASRHEVEQLDSEKLEGVGAETAGAAEPIGIPDQAAAARRERIIAEIEGQLRETSTTDGDLDETINVGSDWESSNGDISFTRNPFESRSSPRADVELEWEDSPKTAISNDAFGDEDCEDSSPLSPPLAQLPVMTSSRRSASHRKRSVGPSYSRSGRR